MTRASSYNESPFGLSPSYVNMARQMRADDEREILDFKRRETNPLPDLPCEE